MNLPRLDGRELLAEIRVDPRLVHIPVVVLSTSDAPEDVIGSYRLHANAYVTKPVDFVEFTRAVQDIGGFFTDLAQLPRPAPG